MKNENRKTNTCSYEVAIVNDSNKVQEIYVFDSPRKAIRFARAFRKNQFENGNELSELHINLNGDTYIWFACSNHAPYYFNKNAEMVNTVFKQEPIKYFHLCNIQMNYHTFYNDIVKIVTGDFQNVNEMFHRFMFSDVKKALWMSFEPKEAEKFIKAFTLKFDIWLNTKPYTYA